MSKIVFQKNGFSRLFLMFLSFSIFISACATRKNPTVNVGYAKPSAAIANKYSTIMKVNNSSIRNAALYNFIDDWMGSPYRFGGLTKNGIDCSGFTFLLFKEVYKYDLPRTTKMQVDVINTKSISNLQEGDLVFFDYDGRKNSHVGVYLQNGYYVHASTRKGVIIEQLKNSYTFKYFSKAGTVN